MVEWTAEADGSLRAKVGEAYLIAWRKPSVFVSKGLSSQASGQKPFGEVVRALMGIDGVDGEGRGDGSAGGGPGSADEEDLLRACWL